ncbi:uncharacterized protein [Amphiura filiformis]|uniref:uncharacterized protein n=1 Tax=Amphiura filiformis TaxID=82378 RepID=UPI003B20C6BB
MTQVTPISFSLTNLTLSASRLQYENTTSDTVANALYFITVQAVSGNGKTTSASSNGIYIDITPPKFDIQFYLDVTRSDINDLQPVTHQASNSTIKAYWNFVDEESEIKAYYWAIGTSKGATDLQSLTNAGLNQSSSNPDLEGHLFHNHTYYVMVKAVNGAGLETVTECEGVTVLLKQPKVEDIGTAFNFSEPLSDNVYPTDAKKTSSANSAGISWTKAEDDSVSRYDYCVGSSEDIEDDIVQCMTVGVNSSGSVAIKDGRVIVTSGNDMAERSISDVMVPDENGTVIAGSRFNMEPGKCLHTKLKVCNDADICTVKTAGTITVIEDGDELMTSSGGEDLKIDTSVARRRRRQAAGQDDFELTIQTSGGLHAGASLVFGFLDDSRASQDYTSDVSVNFRSYITDHRRMAEYASRELAGRIQQVYEPSFFLGSLGQMELQGALQIKVTFSAWNNWQDEVPKLVYWDSGHMKWQDAGITCEEKAAVYNHGLGRATVPVCVTRKSSANGANTAQGTYFSHETQFAVARVSTSLINRKPYLVNLPTNITLNEDEAVMKYQLQAQDADNDKLQFALDLNQPPSTLASVSLTLDGLLTYIPCKDCYGQETLNFKVEEVHNSADISPLHVEGSITLIVKPVNDNPFVFISYKGELVNSRNTKTAWIKAEQNTPSNRVYLPITATIGAYDIDSGDHVTLSVSQSANGHAEISTKVYSIPADITNCNVIVNYELPTRQEKSMPCGLQLPYAKAKLVWVMSTITYTPNTGFYGKDSLHILAHDDDNAASQLLTVDIDVPQATCLQDQADSIPPEFSRLPSDITTTNSAGQGTSVVTWTGPLVTDNCGDRTVTSNYNSGDNIPIGNNMVVITAVDEQGNYASFEFTVNVKDIDDPDFVDSDSITLETDPGKATVATWSPQVSDNSGGALTVTQIERSHNPYQLGGGNTATFTVVDEAGNSATKTFTITVVDREAPTFINRVSDISVNTDSGQSYASVSWTAPTTSDNSGSAVALSSNYQPGQFGIGQTTVTYTAVDEFGNQAHDSFVITVNDVESPTFVNLPSDIIKEVSPGTQSATVTWVDPTANENSGFYTIDSTYQSGTSFGIGIHSNVYTVRDPSGNTASHTMTISVQTRYCPSSWSYFSNYCYYFSSSRKIYSDAKSDCITKSGSLTSILNQAENTFLQGYVVSDHFWIGLDDITDEGTFRWVDNNQFDFANWGTDEPNDGHGKEDCSEIRVDGYWNDVPCSEDTKKYICKKPLF